LSKSPKSNWLKLNDERMALAAVALVLGAAGCKDRAASKLAESPPATGSFSDFRGQHPGAVHKISVSDLPAPNSTPSADNRPHMIPKPERAWPEAPPGFAVQLYAKDLSNPRLLRTAPNGDVLVAESDPGEIRLLRGVNSEGAAVERETFATGLRKPFGIAFYPPGNAPEWLYVANTDSVVRFPYRKGDKTASGPAQTIVSDIPGGGKLTGGGHWTRDIAFSLDGKKMFVSVGSKSNNDDTDDNPAEFHRADILEYAPDGTSGRVFASGIRNAVGIAVHPRTGQLWASVNERDRLGDNLVPDYITHVEDGGFYGWPWFYMGNHQDPRHAGKHPELQSKVLVPDVLLQPHDASLEMLFYQADQFPSRYKGDVFAAEHGSWNRELRTGYEVVRVPMHQTDHASGEYEDFLTGFVTPEGDVWGRPVGVTVANDGALLVSDDGTNSVWRVIYAQQ
jgi:glucose/arabinose dehydrogenase